MKNYISPIQGSAVQNQQSVPYKAQEERAILENIRRLEESIEDVSKLLSVLETRLEIVRISLPESETVEREFSGSPLSSMIENNVNSVRKIGYRIEKLLNELEI